MINNFTLIYIYQKLMNLKLSLKEKETLECIQRQRDSFKNYEELDNKNISIVESFKILKILMDLEKEKRGYEIICD